MTGKMIYKTSVLMNNRHVTRFFNQRIIFILREVFDFFSNDTIRNIEVGI